MSSLEQHAADRVVAAHLVALAGLPGLGPGTLLRCHRGVGAVRGWHTIVGGDADAIAALGAPYFRPKAAQVSAMVTRARQVDPEDELERHLRGGTQVVVHGQPGYPSRLADDIAPPAVLFARGDLGVLGGPTVAVVGTRNATRVGRDFATGLGAELAAAGVAVVSGLALGIDAAAHRGALHALEAAGSPDGDGAPTPDEAARPVGVIAAGLDVVYPRRHVELHRDIARAGLLLSEVPLGERPTEWRFPARNRIIAGLADAVVVAESRSSGGSVLTAGEALERGVPVLAVPGHPSSPASAGTNDLLFDGAGIVRSVRDVLEAIGIDAAAATRSAPKSRGLNPTSRSVLDAIGDQPAALAEVVARCGLELEDVSAALSSLELDGHIVRTAGWYERTGRRGGAS